MKNVRVGKIIMAIGVVALLAVGANAFAGWGKGWHHGSDGQHRGWRMGGPGYGYNLSDEEIAALEKERQAFFNETDPIRQDLYAKDLELRSELAKKNPDAKKAARLKFGQNIERGLPDTNLFLPFIGIFSLSFLGCCRNLRDAFQARLSRGDTKKEGKKEEEEKVTTIAFPH